MNLLHSYFNTRLVEAGLPDGLNLEWSLSYSQGDGVAFYGEIEHTHWLDLFVRIYPNQKRQYRKFERLAKSLIAWSGYSDSLITIERNWFGHRYCHADTMSLNAPHAEDFRFFYEESVKKHWYFPTEKVGEYQALWNGFVADLEIYLRELSGQLKSDGYRIIEATPYEKRVEYAFNTAHYRVELIAEPADFTFSPYDEAEDMMQFCRSLINGETRYANMYAQVLDRKTGLALGGDYIGELTYSPEDKSFSGYKRELIGEAVARAREKITMLQQQFSIVKPSHYRTA